MLHLLLGLWVVVEHCITKFGDDRPRDIFRDWVAEKKNRLINISSKNIMNGPRSCRAAIIKHVDRQTVRTVEGRPMHALNVLSK